MPKNQPAGVLEDAQSQTHYRTAEAAGKYGFAAQTPRAAFCRQGHWMGVVPRKLPNGHLMWPADQIDALLGGS